MAHIDVFATQNEQKNATLSACALLTRSPEFRALARRAKNTCYEEPIENGTG